jgi:non-specific serine/threonine protein kinase
VEPLTEGRVFSHYRIVRKLGEGGMGEVYHAVDLNLERPVAIKLLPPWATGDPEARERLLREARAASALSHPNIVTIHAVEEEDGAPFVVMELLEGETLRDRIARGPLPLSELLDLGTQAADALDAAHAAHLVHRDIKPSNVMITPRGQVKLLDFGLAKRWRPGAADVPGERTVTAALTAPGTIVGTFAYMSPEQSRGERLDPRTDVFSLGAVLYEAATGRAPFGGVSSLAVLHEVAARDPDPPSAARPGLPYGLDLLLARALEKERDRRYAGAAELRDALRALAAEVAGSAPVAPRAPAHAGPNNLPAGATAFVGRAREVAEVKRLLAAQRMVTLTGPGGCGKTRLAVRVAADLLPAYADGAWFVDLAGLADPALVPQAAATAMGLREEAGRPPAETLAAHAASRELLLVLDNCEHLAAACAALAGSLLAAAPRCRVLATSREALGVAGEARWLTPPLSAPPAGDAPAAGPEQALQFESVRLFVERAKAAQASFALTDRNAEAVAGICRELEGIPLAVELAAARVSVLPVAQILVRLKDRFRLLTGGSRDASARQQTLRAAVDWSYDLLSPEERALFNRLSVFAGGLSLEAAEAVCAGEGIDELQVLDLLAHLADKSLVVPEEGAGGAARYRLLETLRQYGRERLAACGEEAAVRERHGAYYLSLAESAEAGMTGPEEAVWLPRLAESHDNFRAALRQAVERGDAARALRLAGALWQFWWLRGFWREGSGWLAAALRLASPDGPTPGRVKALRGAAVLARGMGEFDSALEHLGECVQLARRFGDRGEMAAALRELGNVADDRGDWEAERRYYTESLALYRELDDRRGLAGTLHNLGNLEHGLGEFAKARAYYEEALALKRRLGNRTTEALSLNGLGAVAFDQGDLETARRCNEQGLAIQRETGDREGIAFSLGELGALAMCRGDFAQARACFSESLSILADLGDKRDLARALERFAELAAAEGRHRHALVLLGAADNQREIAGAPRPPSEEAAIARVLAQARSKLNPAEADVALAAGRSTTLETAIAVATGSGVGWEPAAGSGSS